MKYQSCRNWNPTHLYGIISTNIGTFNYFWFGDSLPLILPLGQEAISFMPAPFIIDRSKWRIGFGLHLKSLVLLCLGTHAATNRYHYWAPLSSFSSLNSCWQMSEVTGRPTVETGRYSYMWICCLFKGLNNCNCCERVTSGLSYHSEEKRNQSFVQYWHLGLWWTDFWGMSGQRGLAWLSQNSKWEFGIYTFCVASTSWISFWRFILLGNKFVWQLKHICWRLWA